MRYSYNYSGTLTPEQFQQILGPMMVPVMTFNIILSVITLIAMWKLFEKAGVEGWKCLIPIYNVYSYVKLATGNGWMFLLLLVPFANIIFAIWFLVQLAKSFGQPGLFAVGLVFLNNIFVMILGFGSAEYIGAKGEASN